jgi:hypothetical protein
MDGAHTVGKELLQGFRKHNEDLGFHISESSPKYIQSWVQILI